MDYQVTVRRVEPTPLAVNRGRATLKNLGPTIVALGRPVWNLIKSRPIATGGHNVVIYHNAPDRNLLLTDEGVPLEVGADVLAPFEAEGGVVPSATPGGEVATTTHVGPYRLLGQAHEAVIAWCGANGRAITPPCWEVYGHWDPDESKLTTEVFYRLK